MNTAEKSDSWTHREQVAAARVALIEELEIDGSELAELFLALPIGPKVRVSGVRASLASVTADRLGATEHALRGAGFNEAADEVLLHVPRMLEVRDELFAQVYVPAAEKLVPLVQDVLQRGAEAVAAEIAGRANHPVTDLGKKNRERPPNFDDWVEVNQEEITRAFASNPPLISDRREIFARIRTACAFAKDRLLIDGLVKNNPQFLDYLQCFPVARSVRRKVSAWLGPTNSGKTHRAIQELSQAKTGMYLGPLRLLALEQRDRLVELGQPCSLVTGEERDDSSPTHSSRTVEMSDFSRHFDVCVLDEMQLAFDRDRGWAWIAAYCGVAADHFIVTGPSSVEPVVRRLAQLCGDDIEVNHVERLGTLEYEGVIDWRSVPSRSAVIGFSRAMVLELKAMFESRGRRVSVIYGSLSPEVRREEARRFRSGESDIVCATDAIGLGLNLPLDRVIFYETDKFDGDRDRALTDAEILQIAGRAGRGPGAAGLVAAFSARDGRRIREALLHPQRTPIPDQLPAAPTPVHVRAIADHLGLTKLTTILEFFQTRLSFPGGTFFPDVQEDVLAAAQLVDTFTPSLSVEKRYTLACAPIDLEDYTFRTAFSDWLEALEAGERVSFPRRIDLSGGLESLEETVKLVTAYRWLALKFPDSFQDLEHVDRLRQEATESIRAILRRNWGKHGLARRECAHCRRALLPSAPHNSCRRCYDGEFG